MTPERIAEVMGWNAVVMEAEARREPESLSARVMAAIKEAEEAERDACASVADFVEEKADALNDEIADADDRNEGRSEYVMGKASAAGRIARAIRARGGK